METRALAIAFFYAIGTGVGGIVGPVLSVGSSVPVTAAWWRSASWWPQR
jgi:hypothetical protein